ncbi:MAG: DUF4390 domain-containing protein [Sideroxydans sp.]|nr:DUF4390 domain-containing protein [Sideroxydans sp.]
MTASTTPYCINPHNPSALRLRVLRLVAVLLLACLGTSMAHADGIEVSRAEASVSEDGYQITADFGIRLNFVVEQALTHGIPLYFMSEFSLTRSRWYWLDEEVAHGEHATKLSYNILTRQYRITRGALFQNFDSLEEALRVVGHHAFPQVPASLIKPGSNYVAAVRMRLDVSQLPKPLQVNALATRDWDLDSGWHRWAVGPGAATATATNAKE